MVIVFVPMLPVETLFSINIDVKGFRNKTVFIRFTLKIVLFELCCSSRLIVLVKASY